MSAVTKVFIVLLVVISLMNAAGLVVFVNRTELFKKTNADLTNNLNLTKAERDVFMNDSTQQAAYAAAARTERDAAIATAKTTQDGLRAQITSLQSDKSAADSKLALSLAVSDNQVAALNASEAARKQQSDLLETTRTDSNTLTKKNSDLNLAISDLTSQLEVATRMAKGENETIAANKITIEAQEAKMKDAGISLTGPTPGLTAGAPPINAVVRKVEMHNGIQYATISVGSVAQVKKGMKFEVIDNSKSLFLGELTIDSVDERQATGKLEGPHVGDVHEGTEVKTQS